MKDRAMLKIGEFARIGQASVAMLRHYDQYGLLHLQRAEDMDPNHYVTEAQFPVGKLEGESL